MEGRPGGGRTHAQGKRAGEATTACRLRSCRQLDYLLLLPPTTDDDDGSVALESGGGGGVMVCGPSYFHGEERGREREREGGKRHREWRTYLAAHLEIFVCAFTTRGGDDNFMCFIAYILQECQQNIRIV